jgi:mannose-6-phosphate isomerase-like protein (cupin superfamily)
MITNSQIKTLEILIDTNGLDPEKWLKFPEYGFRQYFLWKNATTGASIALLDYDVGGGIPVKHSHASNQFMYCLEGEYEYTDSKLVLTKGSFYMNPKDHPHGPTLAHRKSILIETYDGPHYYEKPSFHTDETIGGFLANSRQA